MKLNFGLLLMFCGCVNTDAPDNSSVQADTAAHAPAPMPVDLQITQCMHTENAAIYGRPAAQWRAEHYGSEDPTSVNLTVWRMKAGGVDQFSFRMVQSGSTYRIDTVEGSSKVGSGTVTMTRQENGAQFVVSGKDAHGNDVRASIYCDGFVEPAAEGG